MGEVSLGPALKISPELLQKMTAGDLTNGSRGRDSRATHRPPASRSPEDDFTPMEMVEPIPINSSSDDEP